MIHDAYGGGSFPLPGGAIRFLVVDRRKWKKEMNQKIPEKEKKKSRTTFHSSFVRLEEEIAGV